MLLTRPALNSAGLHPALDTTKHEPPIWELRLYVAGRSARCVAALAHLDRVCEEHLDGKYRVEVIDLLENAHLPGFVSKLPAPIREVVDDLFESERVLVGLDLRPADPDDLFQRDP
jgi:circadian clock protein KaiB